MNDLKSTNKRPFSKACDTAKSELHVEWYGSGFPLILLHGNGEDSTYFQQQISALAPLRRLILPDSRGHGQSERGSAPITLHQFAQDLADLMEQMEIEQADLLGFSDGANTALLFALRYPHKVRSLILDGANLFFSGLDLPTRLEILKEYAASFFEKPSFSHHASRKELMELMLKEPGLRYQDLSAIEQPTLVIAGDKDVIQRSHTKRMAQALGHGTLCIVKGSHYVAAENPAAFNHVVCRFLKQVGQAEETQHEETA